MTLFQPAVVSDIRFRSRHVHMTVTALIKETLTTLGWVTGTINFGATPVTFVTQPPDEDGKPVAPNTVAVTIGDVQEDVAQELGGGYYEVVIPIFFDVFGQSALTAQSIADDIKEQVNRGVIIPVYNWNVAASPVRTSSTIEFENVVGPEKPQSTAVSQDFRKYWRVVKAEAHVFYEPTIG